MTRTKKLLIVSNLLIKFVLIGAAAWSTERFIHLVGEAQLAEQIAHSAVQVKITLIDAETGERGYVITGDEKYLEPYNAALLHIDSDINALAIYATKQPSEADNVQKIVNLSHKKMDGLAKVIDIRRDQGFPEAREEVFAAIANGKTTMDKVRSLVQHIQDKESNVATKSTNRSKTYALISMFCVIGFAVSAIFTIMLIQIIVRNPELLP